MPYTYEPAVVRRYFAIVLASAVLGIIVSATIGTAIGLAKIQPARQGKFTNRIVRLETDR